MANSTLPSFSHSFLANGLEAYHKQVSHTPLITIQALVKTGSQAEESSESGLAHMLEHMVFKGTQNFPVPNQISEVIESLGGDLNAYTTYDHTLYYISLPKKHIAVGFQAVSDMLFRAAIAPDELTRETEVICEEIRQCQDNPGIVLHEALYAQAYAQCPMERSITGTIESVQSQTPASVSRFYKRWYQPKNILLSCVGDVDHAGFLEYAEKYFSEPAVQELSLPRQLAPKPQYGVCVKTVPFQEVRAHLSFQAPSLLDKSFVKYDVLSSLLGQGDSSRLSLSLTHQQQLVTAINCHTFFPKETYGLFNISFFCVAPNAVSAFKGIVQELVKLAEEGPSQAEIGRVVNSIKAERIYSQESIDGEARNALYSLISPQGLDFDEWYMSQVGQCTPKDIQLLAKSILKDLENKEYFVSAMINEDQSNLLAESDIVSALHVQTAAAQNHFQTESPSQTLETYNFKIGGKQNLKVLLQKNPRLPLFSAALITKGGNSFEGNQSEAGLSSLTANVLTRGTEDIPYVNFVKELEFLSSSVGAFSMRDCFGLRMDSIAENAKRTVELGLKSFFNPALLEEEVSKIKSETLDVLTAQKDNPTVALQHTLKPSVFGEHAYSHPTLGTQETINSFSTERVRDFHTRHMANPEFTLSLSGDFEKEEILAHIEAVLASITFKTEPMAQSQPALNAPKHTTPQGYFKELKREQNAVGIGMPSFAIHHPLRHAFQVGISVLGGMSGRLFADLREKQSLAYSVAAQQFPSMQGGLTLCYIACAPDKTEQAVKGLWEHFTHLSKETVSLEELERAKESLLGQHIADQQYVHFHANQLALCQQIGLSPEAYKDYIHKIGRVSTEQVKQAFAEVLTYSAPTLAVVGSQFGWDLEQVKEILK